jgi:hypothetical protein
MTIRKVNPITLETAIPFTRKTEDIDRILKTVPLEYAKKTLRYGAGLPANSA